MDSASRGEAAPEFLLRELLHRDKDVPRAEVLTSAAIRLQQLERQASVVRALVARESSNEDSAVAVLARRVLAVYAGSEGPFSRDATDDGRAVLDSVQSLCGAVAQRFSAVSSLHTSEVHLA